MFDSAMRSQTQITLSEILVSFGAPLPQNLKFKIPPAFRFALRERYELI